MVAVDRLALSREQRNRYGYFQLQQRMPASYVDGRAASSRWHYCTYYVLYVLSRLQVSAPKLLPIMMVANRIYCGKKQLHTDGEPVPT
jgi:hypothetical protein